MAKQVNNGTPSVVVFESLNGRYRVATTVVDGHHCAAAQSAHAARTKWKTLRMFFDQGAAERACNYLLDVQLF